MRLSCIQKICLTTFLITLGMFSAIYTRVYAATFPARDMRFQGELFTGTTPVEGDVQATFTFYDAVTAGTIQGSPVVKTVSVSRGYFGTTFTESDLVGVGFGQPLWIEVSINGDTLSPRSTIHSVPLANAALGVLAYNSAPQSDTAGSLYYDTISQQLLVSNGTTWNTTQGTTTPFATSTTRSVFGAGDNLLYDAVNGIFSLASSSVRSMFSSSATGLTYSTTTGAFALDGGYTIPTVASTTEWNNAALSSSIFSSFYNTPSIQITAGTGLSWAGNTLNNTGVTSIGGLTGLVATSSLGIISFSTTTTRSLFGAGSGIEYDSLTGVFGVATSSIRSMFSNNATGLTFSTTTGIITLDSGYGIPTTASTTDWNSKVSSQWVNGLSSISYMDGNVGIGTTTPSAKLAITGSGTGTGRAFSIANSANAERFTVLDNGDLTLKNANLGGININNSSSPIMSFQYNGGTRASISGGTGSGYDLSLTSSGAGNVTLSNSIVAAGLYSNGNFGIGTTTPAATLSVLGSGSTNPFVVASSSGSYLLSVQPTGNTTITGSLTIGPSGGNNTKIFGGYSSGTYINLNSADPEIANGASGRFFYYSSDNHIFRKGTSATELMRLTTSGNVGIGTSTPSAKLAITGTAGTDDIFAVASSTNTNMFVVKSTGNVGIGTGTPSDLLHIFSSSASGVGIRLGVSSTNYFRTNIAGAILSMNYNGTNFMRVGGSVIPNFEQGASVGTFDQNGTAMLTITTTASKIAQIIKAASSQTADLTQWRDTSNNVLAVVTSGGNLGIGTTTPGNKLTVVGAVGFSGLTGSSGAGSLCLSSTGEVVYNSGSDSCLPSLRETKHDITDLSFSASDMITQLKPVSFIYNTDASSTVRYGFIAEDTALIDTHLATYDATGKISGIDDRSMISVLVKAFKEIKTSLDNIAAWFEEGKFRVQNDICVDDVCVTKERFKQILLNNGASVQDTSPTQTQTQTQTTPDPISTDPTDISTSSPVVIPPETDPVENVTSIEINTPDPLDATTNPPAEDSTVDASVTDSSI